MIGFELSGPKLVPMPSFISISLNGGKTGGGHFTPEFVISEKNIFSFSHSSFSSITTCIVGIV